MWYVNSKEPQSFFSINTKVIISLLYFQKIKKINSPLKKKWKLKVDSFFTFFTLGKMWHLNMATRYEPGNTDASKLGDC